MTIQQAHKEFQVFLDKVDSQALPDFLPQEIDIFLHEAEVRIVKSYLNSKEEQRKTDKLSNLFRTIELTATNNEVTLPTDFLAYERCKVNVKSPTMTTGVYTTPFMCPSGKVHSILSDPFNKSKVAYPVIYQESNKIIADTNNGAFTVNKVLLTYIKYPTKVNKIGSISSELSESLQRESISLAITIALESVESSRTQINAGLLPTTK